MQKILKKITDIFKAKISIKEDPGYLKAKEIVDSFLAEDLRSPRQEIMKMIIGQYYQKEIFTKTVIDYSIYDILESEDEVALLQQLVLEDWKEILTLMMYISEKSLIFMDGAEKKSPRKTSFALINTSELRRNTFRII